MDEREVWLTYAAVPGVGRRRLLALMEHFPSAADAWRAPVAALAVVPGIGGATAVALLAARARPQGGRMLEALAAMGGEMVLWQSPGYPRRLAEIVDPPPYFFRLGPAPLDGPVVAVVGSRKATSYGRTQARRLAADLAVAGVTVVSGLARGIDAAAHAGALEAGGRTVAVLGCGPDVCYPEENRSLYDEIRQTGAIVSEFVPGTGPERFHFPERNRLISGLSQGVVVVEAGERSGALITARTATEQGRDVLAVPGPAYSAMSLGPHRLIQDGAALVQSAAEVLAALSLGAPAGPGAGRIAPTRGAALSDDEAMIYGWLGDSAASAADLVAGTGLPAHRLAAALTLLELKGLIRVLPEGEVVRT